MKQPGTQLILQQPLTIVDVASVMWADKWLIVIVTLLCAIASTLYAFLAPEWYRADVVLKPADAKQTQGILSQLGSLGGLASLAGLNLNDNRTSESVATLKSRELLGTFIQDQNLLPVLFARKWDAAAQRWKSNDPVKQPDVRDGIRYFNEHVFSVEEDKKNGLVKVIVDWRDPDTAARWANMLVDRVNASMRDRALALSEYNVAYLKQELTQSTVVTMQQSIGRVLESELQKLLLAKADKEYAFKILDHGQPPRLRYWPKRALVIAGGSLLGLIGACFFAVYRYSAQRERMRLLRPQSDVAV
jgi:LPS O-antigen subunit length determinant protein (WzzB/FepE family)